MNKDSRINFWNDNNSFIKQKTTNHKNTSKKRKNVIFFTTYIILVTILSICIVKIIQWYDDSNNTKNEVKKLEKIVTVEEIVDTNVSIELISEPDLPGSDYWHYVKMPLIQVDFNELIIKNPDTVGWIQVNNTNINYPIVQANDNDYYLNRSYDKSYNEAGWVFMDYRNNNDFSNRNTIIYAHSRLDKTMFGSLSKTLKSNWYQNKDNHIIKISTPYENSLWQIFSIYTIEAESYYITTDFVSDDEYLKFLSTLKSRSKHNFNTSLNSSDTIITLSTCYSDNVRTVVHAKKIKKSIR